MIKLANLIFDGKMKISDIDGNMKIIVQDKLKTMHRKRERDEKTELGAFLDKRTGKHMFLSCSLLLALGWEYPKYVTLDKSNNDSPCKAMKLAGLINGKKIVRRLVYLLDKVKELQIIHPMVDKLESIKCDIDKQIQEKNPEHEHKKLRNGIALKGIYSADQLIEMLDRIQKEDTEIITFCERVSEETLRDLYYRRK